MLRVIAYFAKSLKVTQDHWKWHYLEVWVRLLFAFCRKKRQNGVVTRLWI